MIFTRSCQLRLQSRGLHLFKMCPIPCLTKANSVLRGATSIYYSEGAYTITQERCNATLSVLLLVGLYTLAIRQ